MLTALTIRDFLLIERLEIGFGPGLSVLTGETGAGKSILLDALGLALGGRGEAGLVRTGATQAVIAAEFDVADGHPAWRLLEAQGLEAEGPSLLLRRIVNADGRSRAFINDQPASVGLLRQVGSALAEIEGQFEQHGLLDAATHRDLLDAYAQAGTALAASREAWSAWRGSVARLDAAIAAVAAARTQEAQLRHGVEELGTLAPKPGEEEDLAQLRARLQHRDKVVSAMNGAFADLSGERGAERALAQALRQLERVRDHAGGRLETTLDALGRALAETTEARAQLEAAAGDEESESHSADAVEERLFDLRAMARKHGTSVDALPALAERLAEQLGAIEGGAQQTAALTAEATAARAVYVARAEALRKLRTGAAGKLDKAVAAELGPLRLDKARFATRIDGLTESDWGPDGIDRVSFEVATNPGTPPGPLARIASGGELSRLMLALKLVLARQSTSGTLVFDEVDSGIGGAVAAAVGERLQRLGRELQVLVVTHSPQVAARGLQHWHVAKTADGGKTETRVAALDAAARREEIARMLSGERITEEARAAAGSLLAASAA